MIIKHFQKKNVSISKTTITNIKNRKENVVTTNPKPKKRGRRSTLSERQLSDLKKMAELPNPPTQDAMAQKLKTTKNIARYHIRESLDKRLALKPKVHGLSKDTINKRSKRSWPLYMRLRGQRWKKYITSD